MNESRLVVRSRNNNNNNNINLLKPDERAFRIRKSVEGTQLVIDKCMKHYDQIGDLNALKIAFDGYCTLNEMLKQVEDLCSYGNDFELTK
jgi:hypothetical protein